LFIISIIHIAEIDKSTQTRDHIIHDFAFFTFSSSQPEIKYIIQLIISDITAIIATYFIIVCIKSQPILLATFELVVFDQGRLFSTSSMILGVAAITLFIFIKPKVNNI
jgi:hypothetical protein